MLRKPGASCAKSRAYSSSANLGPGFDVLAVAHTAFYDEVVVCFSESRDSSVEVVEVEGPYSRESGGAETAKKAIEALMRRLGIGGLVEIRVYKGIPPGRGLGSSGASAAAAVAAFSEVLNQRVHLGELVEAAGEGEAAAAGSPHYDNVSASLLGGFVIVGQLGERLVAKRIVPGAEPVFAILVPEDAMPQKHKTKFMRSVVPKSVPTSSAARNFGGGTALLIAGLIEGDLGLVGEAMMGDSIVEKARARHVPCYSRVREAALAYGALGVALSGAGPSMIALAENEAKARRIAEAMRQAYLGCGKAEAVVASLAPGALELVEEIGEGGA
ncbi:homoserine kinase [Pyrofollis japonicus]|nr:homoserine kinase [Pyrofollis japonicus]